MIRISPPVVCVALFSVWMASNALAQAPATPTDQIEFSKQWSPPTKPLIQRWQQGPSEMTGLVILPDQEIRHSMAFGQRWTERWDPSDEANRFRRTLTQWDQFSEDQWTTEPLLAEQSMVYRFDGDELAWRMDDDERVTDQRLRVIRRVGEEPPTLGYHVSYLPDRAVQIGESWTVENPRLWRLVGGVHDPSLLETGKATFTLTAIDKKQNRATLKVEAYLSTADVDQQKLSLIVMRAKGEITIDLKRQLDVASKLDVEGRLNQKSSNVDQPARLLSEMNHTVEHSTEWIDE